MITQNAAKESPARQTILAVAIALLQVGCVTTGGQQGYTQSSGLGDSALAGAMLGISEGSRMRQEADAFEAQQLEFKRRWINSGREWTWEMEQQRINELRSFQSRQRQQFYFGQ